MAQIFVLSGPDIGRSFTVAHGDTLGRSPECVITLKHASLSRNHAHLEQLDGHWFIVDNDSRNGVLVQRQRTPRAELTDMAEFQLGELHLRFRLSAPAESAPRAAASTSPPAVPTSPAAAPTPPAAPARVEEPEELSLEGETDAGVSDAGDGPVFTAGGGARAPVIRPSGDSPYQAAGPFALPKEQSLSARRPGPPAPAPRKLDDALANTEVVDRRSSAPPPAAENAPKLQHSMLDTGFGRGAAPAAGATISRGARKPGEGILQFSKVEQGGVELAQLSGPVRIALYALGVAVMAGVAWIAFRGASALKSRAVEGGGAAQDEQVGDEQVDAPVEPPSDGSQR